METLKNSSEGIVDPIVAAKWEKAHAKGSNKDFPNLDLVRLNNWHFGPGTGKLLEYGFGCGVNLIYLLQCGYQIEAIDVSVAAKNNVAKRLQPYPNLASKVNLRQIDVDTKVLPFADNTFDYITCVSVLSLLGSKERVQNLLSEFRRVINSQGKIIIDINGPNSDFARDGTPIGNDIYEYSGPTGKEEPNPCYCPPNGKTFAKLIEPYFVIDDLGYSSHKYFKSEIEEFIISGHKA